MILQLVGFLPLSRSASAGRASRARERLAPELSVMILQLDWPAKSPGAILLCYFPSIL